MPSGRLLFVLLLGGIPSLMAPWFSLGPALTVILDALFLGVALWDYRRIPSLDSLAMRRILPKQASLGEPLEIVIEIISNTQLFIRVVDGPKGERGDGAVVLGGWVAPGEPLKLAYELTPTSRGELAFGASWFRLRTPLNLVWRDGPRSVAGEVPVHVPLKANPRGTLPLSVLKRSVGAHVGKQPGIGGEFLALREQAVGEGGTRVDWKATARRGVPIIRQFAEERLLSIVFVLDCSLAMGQKVGGVSRLDHAIEAMFNLAQEASRFGDRIGLLAIKTEGEVFLPPRSGMRAIPEMRRLSLGLQPSKIGHDLGHSFKNIEKYRLQSSTFVIFTDIPSANWAKEQGRHLMLLNRRHKVMLATLKDDSLEAQSHQEVTGQEGLYQRAAATVLLDERRGGRWAMGSQGIAVVESSPGGLLLALRLRYHSLRSGGRGW